VLDRILKGTHPLARWFFFSDASSQGELVKLQEVGCLDRRRKALLLSLKRARLLVPSGSPPSGAVVLGGRLEASNIIVLICGIK
jgi:hypothetical protein